MHNPAKIEKVSYANKYASFTVENRQQTFVFRRCDLLMPFFIKLFYLKITYRYVYFGWCSGVFYLLERRNLPVFRPA